MTWTHKKGPRVENSLKFDLERPFDLSEKTWDLHQWLKYEYVYIFVLYCNTEYKIYVFFSCTYDMNGS